MQKPYLYTIFDKNGDVCAETNKAPLLSDLQTWEPVEGEPNVKRLVQTKTAYIDTRFAAKMRLYNYVTYTRRGLPIPKYAPFAGTEIGKSIPILNF